MRLIYDKYRLTRSALLPDIQSVLDVGCRDGVLRGYLPTNIAYKGLDLTAGEAVDVVCNIETGLPFGTNSLDAVVALDVLEHTDNIWFTFEELVRVARRQVLVVLPNIYHWRHRLSFLAGRELGKYRLRATPIADRHRWVTSHNSSLEFCREMAKSHELELVVTPLAGGRRTLVLDTLLSTVSENLGTWATFFDFRKRVS